MSQSIIHKKDAFCFKIVQLAFTFNAPLHMLYIRSSTKIQLFQFLKLEDNVQSQYSTLFQTKKFHTNSLVDSFLFSTFVVLVSACLFSHIDTTLQANKGEIMYAIFKSSIFSVDE